MFAVNYLNAADLASEIIYTDIHHVGGEKNKK